MKRTELTATGVFTLFFAPSINDFNRKQRFLKFLRSKVLSRALAHFNCAFWMLWYDSAISNSKKYQNAEFSIPKCVFPSHDE